jgi:hypothetical protein
VKRKVFIDAAKAKNWAVEPKEKTKNKRKTCTATK